MHRIIIFLVLYFTSNGISQSYAPAAHQLGTTAIFKDSSILVNWAKSIELKRGYLDISDTNFTLNGTNKVTFGLPENALFSAEGNSLDIVSLGDGGVATLTFDLPIQNGSGPDFAIFENSFLNNFLELAFVEVSSDGIYFVRFPSHTEVPFDSQIASFGYMDCRYLNNLAGKYEQGYGTPFDLSDLPADSLLNVNRITHVKIIDVVGSIDSRWASYDQYGNTINDPFPTPFESGGFDLDAVGVINQGTLGISEQPICVSFYPNPANENIYIKTSHPMEMKLFDNLGKLVYSTQISDSLALDISCFEKGVYNLQLRSSTDIIVDKLVIQ